MSDITTLAQRTDMIMVNATETAKQLRELSESEVAEAIFESIIENENGKEIQFERPISDLAYEAFLKIEQLVEALEAAERRIVELEAREEALLPVGVMSEKAFRRLEASECRFIALWPRPGIYLPRKRPDDGVIVYARTAAGIKLQIEGE